MLELLDDMQNGQAYISESACHSLIDRIGQQLFSHATYMIRYAIFDGCGKSSFTWLRKLRTRVYSFWRSLVSWLRYAALEPLRRVSLLKWTVIRREIVSRVICLFWL